MFDNEDQRSLGELAKEVLELRRSQNLSAIAHRFSYAMSRIRTLAREEKWESDISINRHPIAVLYADIIGMLTTRAISSSAYSKAYKWAVEEVKKLPLEEPIDLPGGFVPEEKE